MHGRDGELAQLNKDRNDSSLSKFVRSQADKAHNKISEQMKDQKLMRMRLELINAARAQDNVAQDKIQKRMRAYTKEDRETGL